MMALRLSDCGEWIETVEPYTNKNLFANLETGVCSWNVPQGAKVKTCSDKSSQWWELFDKETKRFYYFNVSSQKTDWQKPLTGDIIPWIKLEGSKQNSQTGEENDNSKKIAPPADPLRRETRRTASARFNRDTSASASGVSSHLSRRNQSQRMPKGERRPDWDLPDHTPAGANVPRGSDQNHSRLPQSDKRSEPPDHWLRQSFGKGDECILGSHSRDRHFSEIIPDAKQQFASAASNSQSNSSTTRSNDEQRLQQFCSNELCSFSSEPKRRIRAGNSSVDSGITADDTCAPYETSCVSLPISLTDDNRFQCDTTEELASLLASIQTTPGSQRRPFPRTNPNFATGQNAPIQKTGSVDGQGQSSTNISCSLVHDQEMHQQNLSSSNKQYIDGSQMRHQTDRSDGFGQKALDSVSKSNNSSRRSADSATCETSFFFRKFPPEASNPPSSTNKTSNSVSSTSSNEYENGAGTLQSGFKQKSTGFRHNVLDKPVTGQTTVAQFIIEEDKLEECRRTRRNSEPDYANLQEIALVEEAKMEERGKIKIGDSEFIRSRSVRAKAEPVYANEHLTGRGCLTHEDRYHLPTYAGNHGSLGSTGSSTISTPSPKMRSRATHLARETRHMSLRRKKLAEEPASKASRSVIDKSRSLHSELIYQHSVAMTAPLDPKVDSIICQVADTLILRADMEQFLSENLNAPRKGLLGKAVPISNMLVWTKEPIQKPMIRTDNKLVKKEAPDVFKLIQTYMGDKKSRDSGSCTALELANKGWTYPELRDEIYVQLCRQTTKNSRDESLLNGWELLGICLSFFPPSAKFQAYLEGHICQTQDSHDHTEGSKLHAYALSCMRRLEKICQTGASRKPNLEDLERSRKSLLHPSMFGTTLDDVMHLQKDRFPKYQLPWIQVTLSEALLNFKGNRMPEGIFRVPGDVDEVNALREKLDHWMTPSSRTDPHVLASVLKLWYRELYEPLVPDDYYDDCIKNFDNPKGAIDVVNELPPMHKLVLTYLIKFLQKFASSEYSAITKMDASNLAMVMAPNCLRCLENNPQLLFENVRKEMAFLRTLIQNLDASVIDYGK